MPIDYYLLNGGENGGKDDVDAYDTLDELADDFFEFVVLDKKHIEQ